jgi:hypothetical protein
MNILRPKSRFLGHRFVYILCICITLIGTTGRAITPEELIQKARRIWCSEEISDLGVSDLVEIDHIVTQVHMREPIHPGSVYAKLGAVFQGFGVYGALLLPLSRIINETMSYVKGASDIYFVEVPVVGGGDIPETQFHYLLANGEVGITKPEDTKNDTTVHDLQDHVTGFIILSRTPYWQIMKNIFKETLENRTSLKAYGIRKRLGDLVENATTMLAYNDKRGKDNSAPLKFFGESFLKLKREWEEMRLAETLN